MIDPAKGVENLSVVEKRELLASLLQKKAGQRKTAPLTVSQQRLWFLEQLGMKQPAYNISGAFSIAGDIRKELFKASLSDLIKRQEILRISFEAADGSPLQVINDNVAPLLNFVELSGEKNTEQAIQKIITGELARPFDLKVAPLLRLCLIEKSPVEHILLITMHHIISDGWSMGIFAREFFEIYLAYSHDRLADLPILERQYSDFAVAQKKSMETQIEAQFEYWKNELAGISSGIELPADYPRPPLPGYGGDRFSFSFDLQTSATLKKMANQNGVTLFMLLLAAFKVLLYRYSSQKDLCIGTPIANRHDKNLENVIGMFVNTLVLRSQINEADSFKQFLQQTKEMVLSAFDNRELPFERLVDELHPQRDLSRSPIFQIMFSFQNAPEYKLKQNDLSIKALNVHNGMSKFDLLLYSWEKEGRIFGTFEYSVDLFHSDTIGQFTRHFEQLLQVVCIRPETPVSLIDFLADREKSSILTEINATDFAYPAPDCFSQIFEQNAEQKPEAVAVEFQNEIITYRELNQRSNRLAHYLLQLNLSPEIPLGICVKRSPTMLVALLAVLKAGCAYIPLDPAYPKERIRYILDDAGVTFLLTESEVYEALNFVETDWRPLFLDTVEDQLAAFSNENPNVGLTRNTLAYIIYTSGSTGKPKGVAIGRGALLNHLLSMQNKPGFDNDDKLLAITTIAFDISALELFLPLLSGGIVVIVAKEFTIDGQQLSRIIEDLKVTVMQATPATWRLLLDSGWTGSQTLSAFCGGEALPLELAEELQKHTCALWNVYGPTETTIWSTVEKVEPDEQISIGSPINNTQVYILDDELRPVPMGVFGNLYIGGDGLARCYFNRPRLTAEKFIPDPFSSESGSRIYATGDVARFQRNGKIQFTGRSDHQVKIRGFRIELGEIEHALSEHSQVRESVVVVWEDEPGDKRLVAYIVAHTEEVAASEFRTFLRNGLPDYMIPSAFVYLPILPRTPNGKLDKKNLPAPGASVVSEVGYVAPQSEIERTIADVWQETLRLDKVGVNDNFFEIGGHSLALVKVQNKLGKIFGRSFPVLDFFRHTSVAALAKYISGDDNRTDNEFSKIQSMADKRREALEQQKKIRMEAN